MIRLVFAATAGLASVAPATAQHEAHQQAHVPAVSAPVTTPIVRTDKTISGQPLRLPQGQAEIAAAAVEVPAGGSLPIHQHPWSRLVYVERGLIRIINHDTGQSLEFSAGQVLPEVVGQWHEVQAVGASPVRLVVFDIVPPGVNNMVMK